MCNLTKQKNGANSQNVITKSGTTIPKTMTDLNIEYYFSKKSLTLATIILLALVIIFSTVSVMAFDESVGLSIFFAAIPLFFLVVSFRRYSRFLSGIMTNQPAVILTNRSLVDNVNRKEYNWTDIKEITWRPNQGKAFGGHTAIILKNSEKAIEIPHNAIKCKDTDFLNDLIRYHNKHKADT